MHRERVKKVLVMIALLLKNILKDLGILNARFLEIYLEVMYIFLKEIVRFKEDIRKS